MRSPLWLALPWALVTTTVGAQTAAPAVTSLADAVRRATTIGPAAQTAVGRRHELVGRARTDAQRLNPIVELRRENEGAPIPYDDFVQVTLPVGLTGRRLALQSALTATRAQATADSLETLRAAGFDAARAWWTAWASAAESRIAVAQSELYDRLAYLDSLRAAEGELAEASALRMRLEAQRTRHLAAQLQAGAAQARGRLAALIAEPDPRRLTLAEEVAPLTALPEVDSALTLARTGRLDLAMARAAVAIAEGRRSAERRAVLPDLGLVGGYKGTGGYETSLFGLTLTAPLLNTNAGNRERTAGEWLRAEAERRATELRVTTEVHAALEAARLIDAGTRDFDARFVARADLVADAAQAAYQEGAASLVELVDAFRAAAEARTAHVRGTLDRALARLDLRRAIGASALETP
jgi:cobalt-zinc-cadmium efflux system outer membrane protein